MNAYEYIYYIAIIIIIIKSDSKVDSTSYFIMSNSVEHAQCITCSLKQKLKENKQTNHELNQTQMENDNNRVVKKFV